MDIQAIVKTITNILAPALPYLIGAWERENRSWGPEFRPSMKDLSCLWRTRWAS